MALARPADMTTRLSLLRCDHCGRTLPATPGEIASVLRGSWLRCCGAEMSLYIRADRPAKGAAAATAPPLALPGANPDADTAVHIRLPP